MALAWARGQWQQESPAEKQTDGEEAKDGGRAPSLRSMINLSAGARATAHEQLEN